MARNVWTVVPDVLKIKARDPSSSDSVHVSFTVGDFTSSTMLERATVMVELVLLRIFT
jgi:hypothetical protein